jgi:pimeloyl-ACP methyl ester carboxylesterase
MKLNYRIYGTGEPVIILHGLFEISDNWVTMGKSLAEHFTVFIPDLRNHGQSPHSPIFNILVLTDDLLEFIQDRQIDNPFVIGHSLGGKVAMNLALNTLCPLKKLVVIDISPRYYNLRQEHLNIISAMASVNFGNIRARSDVDNLLSQTVTNERIRLFIMKNLYRINDKRFGWRLNLSAIRDNIDNIAAGIQSTNTFKQPTLFVRGILSEYITDQDFGLIYKYFPSATIATIPHTSHWVHVDAPDELYSILYNFLGN